MVVGGFFVYQTEDNSQDDTGDTRFIFTENIAPAEGWHRRRHKMRITSQTYFNKKYMPYILCAKRKSLHLYCKINKKHYGNETDIFPQMAQGSHR